MVRHPYEFFSCGVISGILIQYPAAEGIRQEVGTLSAVFLFSRVDVLKKFTRRGVEM
jgi:hypothetical protein